MCQLTIPSLPGLRERARARAGRRLRARASARSTRSTTGTRSARRSRASRSRPGPPSLWRYAPLLPVAPPAEPRLAPGSHAARRGPAARDRARRRRALPEARHGEPDALVQGPRRRRRVREGARARLDDARLLVDRQPRERRRGARGRRGHRGGRVLPGRPRAREADRDGGLRRRRSTRSTEPTTTAAASRVELSFELDWAFVNVGLRSYYAEGSKTLAFEIAEQLGWELPDAVVVPDRLGRALLEGAPGLRRAARARPRRRDAPRLYGGQAEGCAPVAAAFAEDRRVTPLKPDTRRPLARDRQPGRRRPRGRDREGVRRRDLRRRRGRGRAEHGAARRDERRLRRDRGRRHARRAPRGGSRRRARRGRHASSCSSPATASRRRSPSPSARAAGRDRGRRRRAARAARGDALTDQLASADAPLRRDVRLLGDPRPDPRRAGRAGAARPGGEYGSSPGARARPAVRHNARG